MYKRQPKKELFVNNIITENLTKYPFTENMDAGTSLEHQSLPYDPQFWSTYNAPQSTKELSKIEQYLKEATH